MSPQAARRAPVKAGGAFLQVRSHDAWNFPCIVASVLPNPAVAYRSARFFELRNGEGVYCLLRLMMMLAFLFHVLHVRLFVLAGGLPCGL